MIDVSEKRSGMFCLTDNLNFTYVLLAPLIASVGPVQLTRTLLSLLYPYGNDPRSGTDWETIWRGTVNLIFLSSDLGAGMWRFVKRNCRTDISCRNS